MRCIHITTLAAFTLQVAVDTTLGWANLDQIWPSTAALT